MPLEPRASHLHLKIRLANFAHNILGTSFPNAERVSCVR